MEYETTARKIFGIAQQRRAMGYPAVPGTLDAATYEQILEHCKLCEELREKYHLGTFDPVKHWGQTPEQLQASAMHQNRHNTGVRNYNRLVDRYGEDAARKIVRR